MVSIVGEFDACNAHFKWVNAISKVGYVTVATTGDDAFVRAWTIAEKVGQFLRTDDAIKAEAVGYHYCDKPGAQPILFVMPRYDKDYEDNNEVYSIAEADEQKQTSSSEIIAPLLKRLEVYLKEQ